ncbi:polysaccharide biosynthesis/export family protein [Maricaulis salignorans]|uniref:Polysaccharide export outer membrane protein n=2 Tax=Maricaulis salignorans TaxID=144026 RepID=A0A1G9LXU4_9PROT|nr:polysaccharide biosynthesis/export family protein [Maricaulis salignorans]SDL66704.1 polysaccharide export outer membrane protein [Maricaulis salignorans]
MQPISVFRLVSFLSVLLIAACASTSPGPAPADAAANMFDRVEYRLGAGDQLRIIVFGEDDLSGEFVVDGRGTVSLPLIGEIDAGGLTPREFQQAFAAALRDGYLNDPRVSVEVINFRPYYILGEVEAAGEYPFSDGLTVMNAVATAGGFTYRANRRVVFIRHAGSDQEIEVPLLAVTEVQPGDTIRIGERFF